ncbi:ImmA/IrrE family metallo-endopeptidase [Catellatospora sp. KI3]|uniref:helix-turn-helix domain-containing protein n=1 Tax=Catellatospora sp. KI3 TaxID=3041620 RepID=UPI00248223CD|nr:ImmA/IrrE family metallo-endopeptidase [Catellatospora sp. KI3]MDI1460076.1 ImmA/IrrE family metallo-endopeptidase [Catellatospora sp. KI3]
MADSIGERVRALLPTDRTHREVAASVEMTPDAFSRSLSGQRGFSAIEVARIAIYLGVDVHYLITGEGDPLRLRMVARHDFDLATGRHQVSGASGDQDVLDDVALAYRQVSNAALSSSRIPSRVTDVSDALGEGFVRPFISRLEERLGVDVVRLPGLSTSYSFTLSGRGVILVPADGNWFRQNWSLAHELGHLSQGHTDPETSGSERDRHEEAANAFAAELLLPEAQMRARGWAESTVEALADAIWERGISTSALANRLRSLHIPVPRVVEEWRNQPTQRLIRQHWDHDQFSDPVTRRMEDAATRRFPLALQQAHVTLIARGVLPKATLAWMLGVPESTLEIDEPAPSAPMSADALTSALGL